MVKKRGESNFNDYLIEVRTIAFNHKMLGVERGLDLKQGRFSRENVYQLYKDGLTAMEAFGEEKKRIDNEKD